MKSFSSITTFLLIVLAIFWGFESSMPTYENDKDLPLDSFSTDRALQHVAQLSQKPHAVGFPAHAEAREYIVAELKKMGLETALQEGFSADDKGEFCKAINVLARIKGSSQGKALLLLSHYDSDPHSALGASDAASGVATILEGIRAFLSKNQQPENDIIVLITDAEELGLNGADLFVRKHPWASDVGLVLNFEARGSGGPSYVFVETNRGNAKLIREFIKANPEYPMANSLYYSIYKMLPNDTDLTVFREKGDIDGFNFAFIDDHYDYHTAMDRYERLDRNTLTHQGSYLMPLLSHFGKTDLNDLKSLSDDVYFNMPFYGMVSYPFEWIWPMFALAVLCFIMLLVHGFRKKVLTIKEVLKGFLPMFLVLIINGVVGFFAWRVLTWMYPHYKDILHGFTYNGYTYIGAFILFSLTICFWVYGKFRKMSVPNLLIAPILLWMVICGAVSNYLLGASFFIVPVFAVLASLLIVINQKSPNGYLLVLLALPAIWIYAPFIKAFPVGLGLKMMVTATLLTSLTFFLLLPVFGFYKRKKKLAWLSFILFLGSLLSAHFDSGFDEHSPKPTSLLYVMDADSETARWVTYENELSDWTQQYLNDNKKTPLETDYKNISSKYNSGFTYTSEAPIKNIPMPNIETTQDTIIGIDRVLEICIKPQRQVHRLDVFTNKISISEASINGVVLSDYYLKNRTRQKLFTHYISDGDYTEINLRFPKDSNLELTFYEASHDLLGNPLFTIPARPKDNIPMPFVLNDAVVITKTIKF